MTVSDRLSSEFAALADPTRRDIIQRLRPGALTVSEVASHYSMSRVAVSQHLTVLEKAGLIKRKRSAQWIKCSLSTELLDESAQWIDQVRADWSQRLDFLEEHLKSKNESNHSAGNGEKS